jgi:hypothetical protein
MENKEEYKEKIWLVILRRVLFITPFVIITAISCFVTFIIQSYNYIVYGGEVIGYNKITNRKTIFDIYQKIIEKNEKA